MFVVASLAELPVRRLRACVILSTFVAGHKRAAVWDVRKIPELAEFPRIATPKGPLV